MLLRADTSPKSALQRAVKKICLMRLNQSMPYEGQDEQKLVEVKNEIFTLFDRKVYNAELSSIPGWF